QCYIELLRDYDGLIFRQNVGDAPWQSFPVLFPSPSAAPTFIHCAAGKGWQVRRGYEPPLEDWPRTCKFDPSPNARSLAARMGLLPVYSDTSQADMAAISQIVHDSLQQELTC